MNGSSSLFSAKVALISTAVLSTAVMAKLMVPSLLRFASHRVPQLYGSALSWLTPPYLYIVVNCIIIIIAAASRFHGPSNEDVQGELNQPADAVMDIQLVMVGKEETRAALDMPEEYGTTESCGGAVDRATVPVTEEVKRKEKDEDENEEFVISRSTWTPPSRRDSGELADGEKPPLSSRFGSRKSVRASPEGKVLGVSRPKRNETLESTWKMITEGKAPPLARYLKKPDTWETQGRTRVERYPVKKPETFGGRRNAPGVGAGATSPSPGPSDGSGKLRKEPSLSQDDLNRRVEAFIKKFNEEMRLQRQESVQRYMSMLNR